MGTKLSVSSTGTLYDYWGTTIAETLLADLTDQTVTENTEIDVLSLKNGINKKVDENNFKIVTVKKSEKESRESGRVKVIVNLASQEYYKSVQKNVLLSDSSVRIVDCVFKHQGRILSVYAKRARGLMARYIVTQAVHPYTATSTTTTCFSDPNNRGDDAGMMVDSALHTRLFPISIISILNCFLAQLLICKRSHFSFDHDMRISLQVPLFLFSFKRENKRFLVG